MSLGGTQTISITAGTTLRTAAVFTDLISGEPADPATIKAGYQLGDADPVSTTFDVGPIVKDGIGLYHWDIDTTGFALPQTVVIMVIYWQGIGDVDVASDPSVVRVVGPPFALT